MNISRTSMTMTALAPIAQQIWDMKYRFTAADGAPIDQTVAQIYAIAELDNFLGDRLREGR